MRSMHAPHACAVAIVGGRVAALLRWPWLVAGGAVEAFDRCLPARTPQAGAHNMRGFAMVSVLCVYWRATGVCAAGGLGIPSGSVCIKRGFLPVRSMISSVGIGSAVLALPRRAIPEPIGGG